MRRSSGGALLALLLLVEHGALAAEPPPAPPLPRPEREMLEEARRLVDEGRLADARDIHLTLWRLSYRHMDAYRVGTLSYRLRDFPMAAQFLSRWLGTVGSPAAPKTAVPPDFKELYERARVELAQARQRVAALNVQVSDPGAEIFVDGRRVGTSPLGFLVFVAPGQRRVTAQLAGTRDDVLVAAEAGGDHHVRLVLPSAPVAATPQGGPAPAPSPAPAPATAPPPQTRWLRWQTAAAIATPAVLVAGGVAALVAANDAAADRETAVHRIRAASVGDCPDGDACRAFTEADGRVKTFTALSIGAFVGAGIAGVGAGYFLYRSTSATSLQVGARGAGLQITGAW